MEYMTTTSGRAAMELGARLGRLGVPVVGAAGGGLSWMLARCAGCGAALSGADVLFHDGSTPAVGAWLARRYALPAALYFLEGDGCARLWLCDGEGRPLSEDRLPPAGDWAGCSGTWDRKCGADDACAAQTVGDRLVSGLAVAVAEGQDQRPLRLALERLGCEVLSRPRPGAPLLRSDRSGFRLTVLDETEEVALPGRDAVTAAVNWCLARAEQGKNSDGLLRVPALGKPPNLRQI